MSTNRSFAVLHQLRLIDAHALHAGFIRQANIVPDNAALVVGDRKYSYADVDDFSRRLAAGLHEAVGQRPRRVAIFGSRSAVSYIGALAALLAGAAFVPLNPKFPIARTRAMLEQADVDAIIVDAVALPQLHEVLHGLRPDAGLLLPATDASALARRLPGTVLDCRDLDRRARRWRDCRRSLADDLAYLLFTSGSTGMPGGVPITHGNVRAFLDVNAQRYS